MNALTAYAQKRLEKATAEMESAIKSAGVVADWKEDYASNERVSKSYDRLRRAHTAVQEAVDMVQAAKGVTGAGCPDCNPGHLHMELT